MNDFGKIAFGGFEYDDASNVFELPMTSGNGIISLVMINCGVSALGSICMKERRKETIGIFQNTLTSTTTNYLSSKYSGVSQPSKGPWEF